ncbi:MAG: hypothetical protein C0406_07145 [Sideroxydans sp.]|nr:hypothetical protein [Sideroxydans sp.]
MSNSERIHIDSHEVKEGKAGDGIIQSNIFSQLRWRNPLVITACTLVLTLISSIVLASFNADKERELELLKAERGLILQMLQTNGDTEKAKDNLEFLVVTGLVSDAKTADNINKYLEKYKAEGKGPTTYTIGTSYGSGYTELNSSYGYNLSPRSSKSFPQK